MMDFGAALIALKGGCSVSRLGWNGASSGKRMFAYMVPAASYPAQTDRAKEVFGDNALVPYRAYFALHTGDGDVATWVPSASDALADDWTVISGDNPLFQTRPSANHLVRPYIGTKGVYACPMTRGDYNALRGWTVPADEDPADAGYLVEYADGGAPNIEGYNGYVSWSPNDVFERAYR